MRRDDISSSGARRSAYHQDIPSPSQPYSHPNWHAFLAGASESPTRAAADPADVEERTHRTHNLLRFVVLSGMCVALFLYSDVYKTAMSILHADAPANLATTSTTHERWAAHRASASPSPQPKLRPATQYRPRAIVGAALHAEQLGPIAKHSYSYFHPVPSPVPQKSWQKPASWRSHVLAPPPPPILTPPTSPPRPYSPDPRFLPGGQLYLPDLPPLGEGHRPDYQRDWVPQTKPWERTDGDSGVRFDGWSTDIVWERTIGRAR